MSDSPPQIFYPNCRAILQVILDGFGDTVHDSEIQVIPILPKSATVHINSYRQADSFDLVIDASDLPFDPKLVRAGAVEIYIYQTSGIDDDRRVFSRSEPLSDPDTGALRTRSDVDTLALTLKTPASRERFTLGMKPRIVGLFDDEDLEMSDSGKWVTIKGQDYTAYLLAIQWPPMPDGTARRIPVGKRLDDLLGDILADADPDGHLTIDVRGIEDSDLPIVGEGEVRNHARGIPVEQNTTYWDVMYKLAERHGFILFVDGLDVVLSRPKTITDKDTTTIRHMAWGRNLAHLTLKRHLGKEQVPTMVVKSYDPKTRRTITAEYPNGTIDRSVILTAAKHGKASAKHPVKVHGNVKQSTHVSKRGKVKTTVRERDEYQIATVFGITDPKALAKIAETRYHLLGKAERTVHATTKDLRDLLGRDLLDVTAGDAFNIEWDEFNRELMASDKVTEGEKIAHLIGRGFNSEVATTIAEHYSILEGLVRPLRFKEGSIAFDVDDGISIEMELMDFIVIDGIRSDSGAVQPGKLESRRAAATDDTGAQLGWSRDYEDAQQRRFRK